jgi:hypothetical protein
MNEEEKMVFWGDLVEPITALLGGLLVREEYKLVDVVRAIVDKAENAALEEREACAKFFEDNESEIFFGAQAASALRAKGQALGNMNKQAEQNGEEL